ncbi:MAG: polysaccharide deacetylase family protein [Candidatus Nitrosopolaris sp.]
MALSISSPLPLGISANGRTSSSNSNGLHNGSPSTSRSYLVHPPSATSGSNISRVVNSNNKVIMIGFDDGWKGQITYAKPILDKYAFKASFFIVCNYANAGDISRMNWQDIATLEKDGMDIESHSMTHPPNLNALNQQELDHEIGGSKQCLASHRYNSTIFAYPYNSGSNDPTVVRTVAKYYDIGRPGMTPLMFLNCNGFRNHPQTDCRTYGPDGQLNYANRYAARSLSFDMVEINDSFNNTKIFSDFVKIVDRQSIYNQGGKINAVPLLIFHNVAWITNRPYYTNAELFDQLMKYLYENHFKVLTYKQLEYNTQTNTFYLNQTNPANLTKFYNVDVTGKNKIIPKQFSAITQSNPAVAPFSSNSSSNNTNILSYPFHPTPLINHLSVSTTSATSSSDSSDSGTSSGYHHHSTSASSSSDSSDSGTSSGYHHHSTSTSSFASSNGRHHHSIFGKGRPNGNTSKHHEYGGGGGYGGYPSYRGHCSYIDYKSNIIRCT